LVLENRKHSNIPLDNFKPI